MNEHSGSGGFGAAKSTKGGGKKPILALGRRLRFEGLEDRRMLSIAAPSSLVYMPMTGQGTATVTSANNSGGPQDMQFDVGGITSGNQVMVYVDGTLIGSVSAAAATTSVTTEGSYTIPNGLHTFTATQSSGTDTSPASSGIQVNVFHGLSVTSTVPATAQVGVPYTYTVATNAPTTTGFVDAVTVTPGSEPAGMTFDSSTQTFSWTPTAAEVTSAQSFSATVTDTAGNSTPIGPISITVSAAATLAAPTSIQFKPQTGQGTAALTSANNSSSGSEMQFLVSGVTAGYTVNVYADGGTTAIATGTVPTGATTATLTTTGSSSLADGSHTFTATQSGGGTASPSSPGDTVQIYTALTATVTSPLTLTETVGQVFGYKFSVQTGTLPAGDAVTYALASSAPTGATFDAATNTVFWTPTADQAGATQAIALTATDTAGNSVTTLPVNVAVAAANGLTVLTPPANLAISSPVLVAFNDTAAGTPNFSVTTSNNSQLTATLMPETNQVLKIVTDEGEMDFQLLNNYTPNTVSHFVGLVNSGTYTNTTFYRIIQSFMDQGGSGGGGGSPIPVELNSALRFTSSGLLSMANNGVDGNTSEFFITNPNDMSNDFLDFRYTLFGKLIAGDNVRAAIAATPVTTNPSSGENSSPLTPPKILSMSVTTETTAGVVLLQAQAGATGSYTVTVSDGLGHSQNFTIGVGTNSFDPPNPWVQPVKAGVNSAGVNTGDQIYTAANTPVTFTPSGQSADGTAVQVNVQLMRTVPQYPGYYVERLVYGRQPGGGHAQSEHRAHAERLQLHAHANRRLPRRRVLGGHGDDPRQGHVLVESGIDSHGGHQLRQHRPHDHGGQHPKRTGGRRFQRGDRFARAGLRGAGLQLRRDVRRQRIARQLHGGGHGLAGNVQQYGHQCQRNPEVDDYRHGYFVGRRPERLGRISLLRAGLCRFADCAGAPQLDSITVGGQPVTGNTTANNTTTASELSFNLSGVVAGDNVSVYMDGGTTAILTQQVSSGTTITLTTDGSTKLASGNHVFTVVHQPRPPRSCATFPRAPLRPKPSTPTLKACSTARRRPARR